METATIIDNRTLVQEEQLGYASQYLIGHETQIPDPVVRERIAGMSIAEVVS